MVIFYFFGTVWEKKTKLFAVGFEMLQLFQISDSHWIDELMDLFFGFFGGGDFLCNVSPFPSYLHKHTLSGRYPRFSQSCVLI